MIWDARKIDDRTYRRRRAVLGGIGTAIALFLLVDRFADSGFDLRLKGWLVVAVQLAMLGYFVRMMFHEITEMRRHG